MFRKTGINTVACDEGWQVEVVGLHWLQYTESGKSAKIGSEMLGGPAGMAVYSNTILKWLPPHDQEPVSEVDKAHVIENVWRAFKFEGFDIHVY